MKHIAEIFLLILWLVGIVVAKGFWSTLAACLFPPWALYLVAEQLARSLGWIA